MATFEPPVVYDLPSVLPTTRGPARDLFKWYGPGPRGRSVLKAQDGTYTTVDNPSVDAINAAAIAYLGGHVYEVFPPEIDALIAAGYTVTYDYGYAGGYPDGY